MPFSPLKIRAIFLPKTFSMQHNVGKTRNWSPKSSGRDKMQSRFFEKEGDFGLKWTERALWMG
jgi:hypothetical protein